jgi:hypothetical protein
MLPPPLVLLMAILLLSPGSGLSATNAFPIKQSHIKDIEL